MEAYLTKFIRISISLPTTVAICAVCYTVYKIKQMKKEDE